MGFILESFSEVIGTELEKEEFWDSVNSKPDFEMVEVEKYETYYSYLYYCSNCGRWNPLVIHGENKFIHRKTKNSGKDYIYINDVLYCPRCGFTFELSYPHEDIDPLNYRSNEKDINFKKIDKYGYKGLPMDGGEFGEKLQKIDSDISNFPIKPFGYYEKIKVGDEEHLRIPADTTPYLWYLLEDRIKELKSERRAPYKYVILIILLIVIIVVVIFCFWVSWAIIKSGHLI